MKPREMFQESDYSNSYQEKVAPMIICVKYQAGAPYLSYSLNIIFGHKINSANAAIEHLGIKP